MDLRSKKDDQMIRPCRILIVDDHKAVRRKVRALIVQRGGWSVCGEAGDGIEAVDMVRNLQPDIVVMDVSMPRMNGVEAARILRREFPNIDIVMISQNDPRLVRQQAAEVHAQGCVSKIDLARDLVPVLDSLCVQRERGEKPRDPSHIPHSEDWLCGGGTLGKLIREYDWANTALGPMQNWPESLKTSVNLMLNSQHPMWIGWGPEMTFLYNDAYIGVLSLSKHPQALGQPAKKVWAEIWHYCGPLAEQVFTNAEPTFVDDVRLFMRRGSLLEETYYSFSYSPIFDESGKVAGLFCPSTETTSKVLHARRLRTLSELTGKALLAKTTETACVSCMLALAENSDDIPFSLLYLLDADGKKARLQGTTGIPEGVEGISPREILLEVSPPPAGVWPIDEVVAHSQRQVVALANFAALPPGPSGQPLTQATVLPVISLSHNRPVGVLIAGINPARQLDPEYQTFFTLVAHHVAAIIQNAKSAEEERKRADALAEIDRAKTAFFSNVSHEFRTPLTLMMGPIEDMLARPENQPLAASKALLTLARKNCLRLQKLVNALLDFSRIEAGRVDASFEATDLVHLSIDLVSVFRAAIERAGLTLHVNCQDIAEPVYVDREMWEKIVFNLLSNALKFTLDGGITITLRTQEDRVLLSVRDTGIGISQDELPKVFDRFHRAEESKGRTYEGSGIGLALVKELVRIHGGDISVTSEPGRGSDFVVSLPLGMAHLPPQQVRAARTLTPTAIRTSPFVDEVLDWVLDQDREVTPLKASPVSASEPGVRIMVADDNVDMRKYLEGLLGTRWSVETVPDGRSALTTMRRRRPDLLITDVMMPGMDGFALLKELRNDPATRGIPVILLSARAGDEARVEGLEAGADDYIVKPFTARELLARVSARIDLRRLNSRLEESEERLRVALGASGTVAWSWDLRAGVVTHSENATQILGLPREARVSESFLQVHPEDVNHLRQVVQRAIQNRGEYQVDFRTIRADNGKVVWLHNRGKVECDGLGEPVRVTGTTTDINERKRAEEANALLANIVDSSDDAIISKSLEGIITSWNHGAARLLGYTAEEAVGRSIMLIIPADRRQEEATILNKLRRGERIDHFETVRRRKDGSLLDISLTISPIRDSTGRVIGASKVARDITAQKAAERALADGARQQRALFHLADRLHRAACIEDVYAAALDSISAGLRGDRASILLRDEHDVMRFVSSRGLSAKYRRAVEGHSPWSPDAEDPEPVLINDLSKGNLTDAMRATVKAEGIASLAFIPVISNHRLIGKYMVYFDQPHEFNSDELELSLAIGRQLAFAIDRQRAEDALRCSEEQFRGLAETLDAEVRVRTKELEQRNADVLRQSEWLSDLSRRMMLMQDEERRHIARELHDSAGQTLTILSMNLARVTEDIRQTDPELSQEVEESQQLVQQLSREIRTTSYLLHPPLLDESGLSPALHWYVRGLAERSGLDVRLEIAEDFGRLSRDLELVIFRLVQESLTNIHRHSGSKSAQIQVLRDADIVSLAVQDQGKGITPEKLAEIHSRGSGVGIRGMRERARQFHGEMSIESNGSGTRISVVFPAPKDAVAEDKAVVQTLPAAG